MPIERRQRPRGEHDPAGQAEAAENRGVGSGRAESIGVDSMLDAHDPIWTCAPVASRRRRCARGHRDPIGAAKCQPALDPGPPRAPRRDEDVRAPEGHHDTDANLRPGPASRSARGSGRGGRPASISTSIARRLRRTSSEARTGNARSAVTAKPVNGDLRRQAVGHRVVRTDQQMDIMAAPDEEADPATGVDAVRVAQVREPQRSSRGLVLARRRHRVYGRPAASDSSMMRHASSAPSQPKTSTGRSSSSL